MVRINWTRNAVEDLNNVADFISKDSKFYAKRQIIKIRNRIQILKKYPRAGNMVTEYGEECIRELVMGNYRIIYEMISHTRIDILTIHHSARDLTNRNINIVRKK